MLNEPSEIASSKFDGKLLVGADSVSCVKLGLASAAAAHPGEQEIRTLSLKGKKSFFNSIMPFSRAALGIIRELQELYATK